MVYAWLESFNPLAGIRSFLTQNFGGTTTGITTAQTRPIRSPAPENAVRNLASCIHIPGFPIPANTPLLHPTSRTECRRAFAKAVQIMRSPGSFVA